MYLDMTYILVKVYIGATVLCKGLALLSLAGAIRYPEIPLDYESMGGIRAQGLGRVRTLSSQSVRVAGCCGG